MVQIGEDYNKDASGAIFYLTCNPNACLIFYKLQCFMISPQREPACQRAMNNGFRVSSHMPL